MRNRRGISLVWMIVGMSALIGLASLGVDFGRVQIAKTQLRAGADAAACAAAAVLGDYTKVQDTAAAIAAANTCNGTPIAIDKAVDVEFVRWDSDTRTYTVLTGTSRNIADAVRV